MKVADPWDKTKARSSRQRTTRARMCARELESEKFLLSNVALLFTLAAFSRLRKQTCLKNCSSQASVIAHMRAWRWCVCVVVVVVCSGCGSLTPEPDFMSAAVT